MDINIILIIIAIILLVLNLKNKKGIMQLLPLLLMVIITPIYNVLDQNIFVKIFGCGCVPYAQTNMLNIPFNANNLRFVIYTIITIICTILGIIEAKKLDSSKSKIIYVLSIITVNILLEIAICNISMWG